MVFLPSVGRQYIVPLGLNLMAMMSTLATDTTLQNLPAFEYEELI